MGHVNCIRWLALAMALAFGCASGPRSHPLAPGILWAGKWDTNFQEMTLHQQGNRVWGVVNYHEGSLDGTADGDVLRFKWSQRENHQHGRGYFRMSPDGQHLEGRFGYEDNDDNGGRWWADRAEPILNQNDIPVPPP